MTPRAQSFGQYAEPNVVDRFGIWLSRQRMRRAMGTFEGKHIADIGCGYLAMVTRGVLDEVASATLVDFSVDERIKSHPNVHAIEGELPMALEGIASDSIDAVICNNVLEHLWHPEIALGHLRRMLRSGGCALLNVPSWRGKTALEIASFTFHVVPEIEIDDHKHYYSPNELWTLLIASGFRPSEVKRCHTHKLGLNTFAECRIKK